MKKLMLMGLLVMLGLSFAPQMPPESGPDWSMVAHTACQGAVATYQAYDVWKYQYQMYNGQCAISGMPYSYTTLCEQVCSQTGIGWYWVMAWRTCEEEGQTSPECINAKAQFYSRASAARGMFSATRTAYLSAARQAIFAYGRGCTSYTWPEVVSRGLSGWAYEYRACLQDTSDYMEEFCAEYCAEDT